VTASQALPADRPVPTPRPACHSDIADADTAKELQERRLVQVKTGAVQKVPSPDPAI